MSNFSKKPQAQNTGTGNNDYSDWNQLSYDVIDGKEQKSTRKDGSVREGVVFKKKKMVGILASIIDIGLQPQKDADYDSKCKEHGTVDGTPQDSDTGIVPDGYSEEEKAHVAKFKNNYFQTVDGKRKQFKPERPQQEYAFYFDFYKAPVDWTKHPVEALHELGVKPLRVCYNGHYENRNQGIDVLSRNLRLEPHWQTGKLSPNNPIYKMAVAMDVEEGFSKEYDLGELVEGACFFDVYVEKNSSGGKDYINYEIKNFSEVVDIEAGDTTITREQQIPEVTEPFIGVHFNGAVEDYDELSLKIVRSRMNHELKSVLPNATAFQPNAIKAPDFWLGCNWEDSGLCKALDKLGGNTSTKPTPSSSSQSDVVTKTDRPSGSSNAPKVVAQEPVDDFDDNIPF